MNDLSQIEKRLWEAADQLRANSSLRSFEYSVPVLGLIFLRYADFRFERAEREIEAAAPSSSRRRTVGSTDYQARGALFLPPEARYQTLLELPDEADVGAAVADAMRAIEAQNDEPRDVLPKNYGRIEKDVLKTLLKTFNTVPLNGGGDVFGKIYEYFLGKFAMSEGQQGGEFFTPTPIVALMVEILEPFRGRILDPACGSGGMFVQSARFIGNHKGSAGNDLAIYGQEKTRETVRLCKMNLAVHGLAGEVREGNTYYEDLHGALGQFDFVMANPPFNVDGVARDKLKDQARRFPLGMPTRDNANFLWMQILYSALNDKGRAGFVMASSAGDAESAIRQGFIEAGAVDCLVAVGPNFFYTVTLPCTLWFFDRGKKRTAREDTVLFLDARAIFRQLDRAHRDWTPAQIEFLANIVRLYRGEEVELEQGSADLLSEHFADENQAGSYVFRDVPGLCKRAARKEIEAQGWSLNPGRYVGVGARPADDFVFAEKLELLSEELELLTAKAHDLESRIAENVAALLQKAV